MTCHSRYRTVSCSRPTPKNHYIFSFDRHDDSWGRFCFGKKYLTKTSTIDEIIEMEYNGFMGRNVDESGEKWR